MRFDPETIHNFSKDLTCSLLGMDFFFSQEQNCGRNVYTVKGTSKELPASITRTENVPSSLSNCRQAQSTVFMLSSRVRKEEEKLLEWGKHAFTDKAPNPPQNKVT